MHRTIAFTTALGVLAMLPAKPAAANVAELLLEKHYSEADYEVDLYVTRGADGGVLSEATLSDPASGETVDVWTDGTTIWWDGVIDGERVDGSLPSPDVTSGDPSPQPICFTPITAIICVGALVVASGFAGCAHGKGICRADPSTEVPGGGGGVPPAPDDGGGGDGGDDGGGGSSGGGDED